MTKILIDKATVELALDALEYASTGNRRAALIAPAIAAFKQALAEPQQQPEEVTWGFDWGYNGDRSCAAVLKTRQDGVTEVVAIEYDPRTAASSPAQPQQEPVAWRTFDGEGGYDYRTYDMNENYAKEWDKQNPKHKGWVEPLYTSPPASKPLTDEEIGKCIDEVNATSQYGHHHFGWHLQFARAIEAAHGIKENT